MFVDIFSQLRFGGLNCHMLVYRICAFKDAETSLHTGPHDSMPGKKLMGLIDSHWSTVYGPAVTAQMHIPSYNHEYNIYDHAKYIAQQFTILAFFLLVLTLPWQKNHFPRIQTTKWICWKQFCSLQQDKVFFLWETGLDSCHRYVLGVGRLMIKPLSCFSLQHVPSSAKSHYLNVPLRPTLPLCKIQSLLSWQQFECFLKKQQTVSYIMCY